MVPSRINPVLRVVGLGHKYGDREALHGIDLEIQGGEVFGYVGPNGAGKTTTFRILSGLLRPTAGQAFICGEELTQNADRIKQLVGYLPDHFGVYPNLSVVEYLDFFAAAYRIAPRHRAARIEACLDVAGIADLADRLMGALSRGMKQRVGIAKTLLHDPPVLILDEPAATLDPRARIHMRQLLRELANLGKAVVVSSHVLREMSDICDRVGILSEGRLVACGGIAEILRDIRRYRMIEIHTLGAGEAVQRILARAPGCWRLIVEPRTNGTVRYQVEADEQQLIEAMQLLFLQRVPVVGFHEVPADLEDAFMSLTR